MDSHMQAIVAVVLMLIAAALFMAEVLVPSGGLIGVLAAVSLIASLFFMFNVNATFGWVGILVSLIGIPALMGMAMKIFPDTPIGRMLILGGESRKDDATPTEVILTQPVVGDEGQALGDLRPVGTCVIGGKRYDCMAVSGVIRAGQPVRVVQVDGMQIKVREKEWT